MEVLSEHQCQGWLEGYLLTGRHGLFNCYEAFIHIIDSMFNQHAKWLKVTRDIPWRRPIASLNYLLSSHVWRQDHNGFSHQDPGFIDHVVNKKAEVIRVYLPPDANTLLSVADHCLRSRNYVNVIVAGKQPAPNWLTMDEAVLHCTRGHRHLGLGQQRPGRRARRRPGLRRRHPDAGGAGRGGPAAPAPARAAGPRRQRRRPDAAAGREGASARPVRPRSSTRCSRPTPVVFAYHGYPWLIHRLTYRRTNHANIHVRGYKEEGTTTTPFDMVMLNDLDRFHLVIDVIDRVPGLGPRAAPLRQQMVDERLAARAYTRPRARTRPRSRLGVAATPGRDLKRILVVNAGSSSLKLRVLDDGDAVVASSRPAAAAGARRRRARARGGAAARRGRRRRPPRRARRDALPSARCSARRRRPRPASPALTDLAPLHQPKALAALDAVAAAAARRARGRLLRHGVPRHAAGGGGHLRAAPRRGASAGTCGATASTACRTPTRPGAPASCWARAEGPAARHLPPRRRRVAGGGARRALRGHDDGLHAAGGPGHGHAIGLRGSRPGAVAGRPRRHAASGVGRRPWSTVRACSAWPAPPTCARSWPARKTVSRGHAWRSTSTSTACAGRSPPWPPPSAGWTRSSSPAASASALHPSARWPRTGWAILGITLDPARNLASNPADREIGGPGATVRALVVTSREDIQIAGDVRSVLGVAGPAN